MARTTLGVLAIAAMVAVPMAGCGGGGGGGGDDGGAPPACGDGVVDPGEECDAGGEDTAGCDADCTFATCGDHHRNGGAGEVCDDGNNVAGDGCSADCRSDETCGNGILDDHLPRNPINSPQLCLTATQQGTGCAEVCDDGNNVAGDGCSANCLSDEGCPNGIRDPGESCDDGNHDWCDACPNDCRSDNPGWVCGDGIVSICGTEQCDPGGMQDSPTCDWSEGPDPQRCTFAVCGDGHVNAAAGEQCDRGADNGMPGSPCTATCTLAAP